MIDNSINPILLAVVILGLLPLVLFVFGYARVQWRSTPAGKSAMLFAVVATIVMGLVVCRYLGLGLPNWARYAVYGSVGVAAWWQYLTFLAAQNTGRRRDQRRLRNQQERGELRR